MKRKTGLFYGSETGNTEYIAGLIEKAWGPDSIDVHNVFNSQISDFEQYDFLILGIPSWYDGQLQGDWDQIFEDLDRINFHNRIVAVYGLGDQQDWGDFYLDAMGTLAKKVIELGAMLIGRWPNEGYDFIASKAIGDTGDFYGLALDEDWQPELSEGRIKTWVSQLKRELNELQQATVA